MAVQGYSDGPLLLQSPELAISKGTAVLGLPGPHGRSTHARLSRAQRNEPFTPRLPRVTRERPLLSGVVLAAAGIAGNWFIVHQLDRWPGWLLFPSLLLAVLCLAAMVIGLGVVTVCALEPALGKLTLGWDADPVAALAVPPALQRKCEQLGYWTADDVVNAVSGGTFPWTALEYDERQQLDRAAQRWQRAVAAEQAARKARKPFRDARGAARNDSAGD